MERSDQDASSREWCSSRAPLPPGSDLGIAERWFWLTYDTERARRLPVMSALDAAARSLDRVVAGGEPEPGWQAGPPSGPPTADQADEGRVFRARCLDDVRCVLAGQPPRDLSEALLMWLVKFGDIGGPDLRRALFPSRFGRVRGGRELRRLRPALGPYASRETVEVLLEMLREIRPSAAVGYLGEPTGA